MPPPPSHTMAAPTPPLGAPWMGHSHPPPQGPPPPQYQPQAQTPMTTPSSLYPNSHSVMPPPPPTSTRMGGPVPPPPSHGPGRYPAAAAMSARPTASQPHHQPSHQQTSNSGGTTIDPAQLPRVAPFTRPHDTTTAAASSSSSSSSSLLYTPHAAIQQGVPRYPPESDVRCIVHDDGQASPHLLRATAYCVPVDRRVWHYTGDVPLGLVCTPLAVSSVDVPPRPRHIPSAPLRGGRGGAYGGPTPTNDDDDDKKNEGEDDMVEEEPWTEFGGGGIPVVDGSGTPYANSPFAATNNYSDQGISQALSQTSLSSKTSNNNNTWPLPPRCSNCGAYVNPFFGATQAICNFCGTKQASASFHCPPHHPAWQLGTVEYVVGGPYITRSQPVQPIYLYALDLTACSTSQAPAYFQLLQQVGTALHQAWTTRHSQSHCPPRIGICLFCSAGIFVRHKSMTRPDHPGRYVLMPDVTLDPFPPLPLHEWTFALSESSSSSSSSLQQQQQQQDEPEPLEGLEGWKRCLDELAGDLEQLRGQARQRNAQGLDGLELSCAGAAASFLAQALHDTGGRGTVLTARRPNFGVGSLPHREQVHVKGRVQGIYPASTPLQYQQQQGSSKSTTQERQGLFYQSLAQLCSKRGIAMDIVMHTSFAVDPPPFLDVATLSEFCRSTCGQFLWVSCRDWQTHMYQELTRHVQAVPQGADAVFKVRCSAGLQVKAYYPGTGTVLESPLLGGSPELELAHVSPSTAIAVELDHRVGGIPKDTKYCYVQSALLYTTPTGSRRVRVSTLALRTSSVVDHVFSSIDFLTTMTMILRQTVSKLHQPQPHATDTERELTRVQAGDAVVQHCILRLASYRQHGTQAVLQTPLSQLVLPDKLQLYPMFCMGLFKSPMLRPGTAAWFGESSTPLLTPTADERAYFIAHAAQCHPAIVLTLVHPMVYPVFVGSDSQQQQDEATFCGEWKTSSDLAVEDPRGSIRGYVPMPTPILASRASLANDEVYLLDTGLRIYVVVGKDARDEYKQGWSALVAAEPKVARMVWQIRAFSSAQQGSESNVLRPIYAPVHYVVLQEKPGRLETLVWNLLMDDAVCGEKSLSDYLVELHKKIRQRLDHAKK